MMTEYSVSIGNNEYEVRITDSLLLLNREPFEDNLIQMDENSSMLFQDKKAVELYFFSNTAERCDVFINGQKLTARIENSNQRFLKKNKTEKQINSLSAVMPGLVIDVLVKEGDQVEENQAIVVLESMKMQMHLRASVSGNVEKVFVKPGQRVEKGESLIVIG